MKTDGNTSRSTIFAEHGQLSSKVLMLTHYWFAIGVGGRTLIHSLTTTVEPTLQMYKPANEKKSTGSEQHRIPDVTL